MPKVEVRAAADDFSSQLVSRQVTMETSAALERLLASKAASTMSDSIARSNYRGREIPGEATRSLVNPVGLVYSPESAGFFDRTVLSTMMGDNLRLSGPHYTKDSLILDGPLAGNTLGGTGVLLSGGPVIPGAGRSSEPKWPGEPTPEDRPWRRKDIDDPSIPGAPIPGDGGSRPIRVGKHPLEARPEGVPDGGKMRKGAAYPAGCKGEVYYIYEETDVYELDVLTDLSMYGTLEDAQAAEKTHKEDAKDDAYGGGKSRKDLHDQVSRWLRIGKKFGIPLAELERMNVSIKSSAAEVCPEDCPFLDKIEIVSYDGEINLVRPPDGGADAHIHTQIVPVYIGWRVVYVLVVTVTVLIEITWVVGVLVTCSDEQGF